ncbi:MAG TPA: DUF362 domain-containing protein [Firmicutes bacterium]|jgi:uncharacterized protein (DUF362 family)|nr:DUF362 domain-containing protein [Bacillota bacterium]
MKKNQIFITYGEDPRLMIEQLLAAVKLEEMIKPGGSIGLKPNLVVGKPADSGATTHPEIVEGIITYLLAKGFKKIVIMEGSWIGDDTKRAFAICGYQRLAEKYNVELIDLKGDQTIKVESGGLSLEICSQVKKVDFLINLPVLKAHCQTELTCALKNLKGCIPDREKRRFHSMGLHKPIAALSAAITPHLTIVDALCGDLTFEEGGNPVPMGRLIAGSDPVLLDAYAADLIGLKATDIPYISIAHHLGVGEIDLAGAEFIETNPDDRKGSGFRLSHRSRTLSLKVDERQSCSACYGSLIHALHRLEEEGSLNGIPAKSIKIGQGYKGEGGKGPGIGNCTKGYTPYLKGCPPTARQIKEFLRSVELL